VIADFGLRIADSCERRSCPQVRNPRGADLMQYLAHQISKEDALKRIEVKVF